MNTNIRQALNGIPTFLQLGIPGMLQLCLEWWAFEILALASGLLQPHNYGIMAIGANAVVMNVSSQIYMVYLGISISGNVRIGNALGAGDANRAKVAARVTIGLSVVAASICATLLFVFRTRLPQLLIRSSSNSTTTTTEEEDHDDTIHTTTTTTMNDLAAQLLYVAALFQIPDAINAAIQGIFRGSGRQSLGAQLNFVAYYLLGLPFGCLLAFYLDWGVLGLWIGITMGLSLIALFGMVVTNTSQWDQLAEEAKDRLNE